MLLKRLTMSFALFAVAMVFAFGLPAQAFDLTPPSKSFEEERAVAASQHEQILAQFGGEYEDADLAAYVTRVGDRVAASSDMPDKPFKFTVLNTPMVNAFTVGGGYVYVTRGILASINSEAELAALLAHETAHVTERHTARRETRMQQDRAASIGVGLLTGRLSAALLAEGVNAIYRQAYSRGQEDDADRLGVVNMNRAGYDPYGMADMLAALKREVRLMNKMAGRDEDTEPDIPIWLSDHPDTDDRIQKTTREAELTGKTRGESEIGRDAHLDAVDGALFGDDPRFGVLENGTFKHPEFRIAFDLPEGYVVHSMQGVLLGVRDERNVVIFTGADWPSSRSLEEFALSAWYSITDGDVGDLDTLDTLEINGLDAVLITKSIENRLLGRGTLASVAYRMDEDIVFSLSFLMSGDITRDVLDEFRGIADSFRKLSEQEIDAIAIPTVSVVEIEDGDTLESLSDKMLGDAFRVDRLKALNGIETLPPVGERVKIVVDGGS